MTRAHAAGVSLLFALFVSLAGCPAPAGPSSVDDAGAAADGATDGGPGHDAGPGVDGSSPDVDAAGPGVDGGPGADAASLPDAASPHHVVYDANGATSGTAPFDLATYFAGQTVTLAPAGDLARTGATFMGWSERADGAGTLYAPGDAFVMGPTDVLFYATWTALPTYAVTYHADDANGGTVPADPTRHLAGDSVTAADPGDLFRYGATFDAWTSMPAGAGTRRVAGASFTMPASDVDLYAAWTLLEYTLTYDANGATGGTVPVDHGVYHFGDIAPVAGNTGNLVRTGYTFQGWNTQPDGSGGGVIPGGGIEIVAGTTIYALWEPDVQRITFDPGSVDATGSTNTTNYVEAPTGSTITLPANGFVRTYWAFGGWGTAARGATSYRDQASFVVPPGPVTLYAEWTVPLVAVAGGTFQRDTTTTNRSTVSDFWIGTYEVTVDQMLDVTGASPSTGATLVPEHRATWYHALVFCNRLSAREGLTPVYAMVPRGGGAPTTNTATGSTGWGAIPNDSSPQTTLDRWNAVTADWTANGYRLPTEMEWLWAAMDRDPNGYTRRWAGDVGTGTLTMYGWVPPSTLHAGGGLLPTALGIYDMAGNVYEYVWDRDAVDYAYPNGALVDYHGKPSGQARRVIRGGAYDNASTGLGEIDHVTASPSVGADGLGFRIARGHL